MAFYLRILGLQDPSFHLDELKTCLQENGFPVTFKIFDNGSETKWHEIEISDAAGIPLIYIERDPVIKGELGREELEELKRDIQDYKPKSAVKWLNKYLEKIKVIYAIELYDAVLEDNNYPIIALMKNKIHSFTGGIFQGDDEGFYNEKEELILWQFPEDVTGEWNMAIMDARGMWTGFAMELGNKKNREAFFAGKLPE